MLYAALVLSLMANVATVLAWRQMRKKWRWEQRAAEALAHKVALLEGPKGVA